MPTLTCDVSAATMQALLARRARTGEPLSQLVEAALGGALDGRATLFQVSTAGALVRGIFDGVVTVGELKRHGDFGLGTFDGLDGEMIALDGRFFHIHPGGAVSEATSAPASRAGRRRAKRWSRPPRTRRSSGSPTSPACSRGSGARPTRRVSPSAAGTCTS